MVDVAAGIEVQGILEMQLCYDVVLGGRCCLGGESCVQVVDVGLVVLGVVKCHDLSGDAGLECL